MLFSQMFMHCILKTENNDLFQKISVALRNEGIAFNTDQIDLNNRDLFRQSKGGMTAKPRIVYAVYVKQEDAEKAERILYKVKNETAL